MAAKHSAARHAREPIPIETARQLCAEIYAANRGRWWTVGALWCKVCAACTPGSDERLWACAPGNRGCAQVSRRFDRLRTAAAPADGR
jgi:hypothetical protein